MQLVMFLDNWLAWSVSRSDGGTSFHCLWYVVEVLSELRVNTGFGN